MKYSTFALSALTAFAGLAGTPARADNMVSIAITPATGVVTLAPRWSIASGLAGFHQKSQDLGIGGAANNFYSIRAGAIPAGGDILAFNYYVAGSGAATPHADIGSKLTPNSYSALTSADPDVGFGSVHLYLIHHKGTTDYFTHITPGSGTSSAVTDLKPMSGPGGPGTVTGVSGYFGLTFAASNLGYGLNMFYYLRTDPVTGFTKFGTLAPALLSASADQFDLGLSGHNALTFTGTDVGFGTDKMYYLRLDPVTGFTILGTLHPVSGRASDIANLGSVYTTLNFVPGDVGFGTGQFYSTGAVNPTWQSVSFAAINDRAVSAGSFTVNPTASSALPIVLTVVPGSTGAATISGPVGGVFTVTPTQAGLITLQAAQAGQAAPTAFEGNMLRQSFTATGTPVVTNSPLSAPGTVGAAFSFTIAAGGPPTSYSATPLPAGLTINATTGAITGTPTTVGTTSVLLGATNASGTGRATMTITVAAAGAAPIIVNSPLTAPGTVGTAFSFAINATGLPTSYTATPLPAGLSIVASTGVISGTPTAAGTTSVVLGATNTAGTRNATLTLTVGAASVAPLVTSPAIAVGAAGAPFVTYVIAATNQPTSYNATGLPAGLTLNTVTGAIDGTPTTAGTYVVTIQATNANGTTTTSLAITITGSRIVAFSARSQAGVGSQTLIMGFAIQGDNKTLLVRGLGTTLASQGVTNALADPQLSLYSGGTQFSSNDDWGTGPSAAQVPAVSSRVGLAALAAGGKDSALIEVVNNGVYTSRVSGANGTIGTALTEVYDADSNAGSRLIAVSARLQVNAGDGVLIGGFIIAGASPKTVLIRGIGPSLSTFGVTGVLADPQLTVYSGGTVIGNNDDWGTGNSPTVMTAAFSKAGEFPLVPGSKDAALLLTLQPGAYTVHLSGVAGTTGVALVEIYDTE